MHELLKVLFVFGLIVVLLKFKWNLGGVMLIGAAALGLLMRMPPARILTSAWHASADLKAVSLIAALALIMVLENVLRNTETLKKMVESLKRLAGDQRVVMALMPAIIGVLPSAGGAYFSAPMVAGVSEGEEVTPERKSFINYWFRHIWEYISPLYPGFILMAAITGIHMGTIFLYQAAFPLTVLLTGALFAFKGINGTGGRSTGGGTGARTGKGTVEDFKTLTLTFSPILIVMLLVMALKLDIAIALGIVVAGLFLYFRYGPGKIYQTLRESLSWKTLVLVWGVEVFRTVMQNSGAVDALPGFFKAEGIPVLAILFILPFLVGMITGITLAFVGVTFPMIMPLIGGARPDMGMLAFAFASGFAGVMFSPVHLCLVLTKDYFKSELLPIFRIMLVPELIVLAAALAEAIFL